MFPHSEDQLEQKFTHHLEIAVWAFLTHAL